VLRKLSAVHKNAELMNLLGINAIEERDMTFQAGMEAKVPALTAAQIAEALRKHVDLAKISYFKAVDFTKAGVTQ
jgi:hypothetical protein